MTDNEEAKEEPLAKRPKTESGKAAAAAASKSTIDGEDVALLMSSILSPHILKDEAKYKSEYASATPYMHGRLVDMFADGFLKQVLEEVKQNTKVTFKESDLFRVYQSVDLGNIKDDDEIALKLPSLMKLKHVVYSKQFREFIERVIQLPRNTLIDHTDCAANCHAPGCHLLCHDDVIGTRKVSFIIYLTENDWTREEGGCLELYESEDSPSSSVPQAFPSKTILPTFNTMAFFEVKPGVSFHSVQEVYGERPRLSIQGE
jgi:Rps23 Pro-64 3,4-dihydroxylase Tpa1-like proline 4-hydroxylase